MLFLTGCGCPDYSTCNIVPKNGSASCHVVSPPISCNVACDSGLAFADRNFTNTFLHCPNHRWTKQVPYCASKSTEFYNCLLLLLIVIGVVCYCLLLCSTFGNWFLSRFIVSVIICFIISVAICSCFFGFFLCVCYCL